MTYSKRIRLVPIWVALAIALAIVLAVSFATPRPAGAVVDEIAAALCNGGEPLHPKGQAEGAGFVRSLLGSGFIESIDFSVEGQVTVNFDPTVPASKFKDAGVGAFTIPDGFGPGTDLTLSPLIEPDPDFPAHAHCPLFPGA
jgi:hypothetical protein